MVTQNEFSSQLSTFKENMLEALLKHKIRPQWIGLIIEDTKQNIELAGFPIDRERVKVFADEHGRFDFETGFLSICPLEELNKRFPNGFKLIGVLPEVK